MSSTITCVPYSKPYFHNIFGSPSLCVIFIFFLVFAGTVVGQNLTTPTYVWESEVQLPTVNATLSGVNTDDITIAVATDPQGNVYTLSFGKGVAKRSATGELLNASFIPANRLDSPLDIAIDENGFIYVADYFAGGETSDDNGKIWVFSPEGALINSRIIYTSFYRPLGVDVDEGNVYVAEFNDGNSGPENNQLSRIRIYDKNSGVPVLSTADVNTPFRIAVDSQKNIYVSQAGNGSPSVRIYNQDLIFQGSLPNILSPGSIVIDPFDFIHVIEYDGRIDFSQFINFENLGFSQIQSIAKKIDDGQKANAFSIKIFDPNRLLKITLKDQIDFPVDFVFNNCDKMYVNNSKIFGSSVFLIGYIPDRLEFDLEIYQRTPGFDTEKPLIVQCPSDKPATLTNGKFTLLDYREDGQFKDACDSELTLIQSPAPGVDISETTQIIISATDDDGNISESCIFSVIIEADNENQEPIAIPDFYSVWEDNVLEVDVLDGVLQNDTDPEDVALIAILERTTDSGVLDLRPDGSFTYTPDLNFNGTDRFTYFANDGQQNSNSVVIVEIEVKAVPDVICKTSFTLQLDATGEAFLRKEDLYDVDQSNVQFALSQENFTCANLGENTVNLSYTYTILDEGEFTGSCDIEIIVVDDIIPVFETCLGTQEEVFTDGEFILPDYRILLTGSVSDNCALEGISMIQTPAPETPITANTSVDIVAYDSSGNESVSCSFEVRVSQAPMPMIVCPDDNEIPEMILDENCSYENQDFTSLVTIQNSSSTELIQTITRVDKILTVKIELKEDGVIVDDCTFFVNLLDKTAPIIDCPSAPQILTTNEDGKYIIPDYASRVTDNCDSNPIIDQVPEPGTEVTVDTPIRLTAKDDSDNDSEVCEFILELQVPPGNQAPIAMDDTYTIEQDGTLNISSSDGVLMNDEDETPNMLTGEILTDVSNGVLEFNDDGSFTYTSDPDFVGIDEFTYVANDGELDSNPATVTINVGSFDALEITCPSNQTAQLDGNCQLVLLDYTALAGLSDEEAEVTQDPLPGAIVSSNTQITLTATIGNSSVSCTFQLVLEGDVTAPVASCVSAFEITLSENGTATITPSDIDLASVDDCGGVTMTLDKADFTTADLGENTVILTVTDGTGNSNTCESIVTVLPYEVPNGDFECQAEVTLQLGRAGTVSLNISDTYTGAPGDREFSLSTSNFDCTNIGENSVELNYTGDDGSGSCIINVRIEDTLSPEIKTQDINISLDAFGFASITPDMIDNGTSDNCGVPDLGLDILDFSCKNLGENTVLFTATDASGNSATQTAIVNITGNCEEQPISAIEYIFIYPNPTRGPFTFETPTGWIIEKVDVFDYRGRYITTVEFAIGQPYNMDLSTLQTAVYTLHLTTNQGNKIIRVIIQ